MTKNSPFQQISSFLPEVFATWEPYCDTTEERPLNLSHQGIKKAGSFILPAEIPPFPTKGVLLSFRRLQVARHHEAVVNRRHADSGLLNKTNVDLLRQAGYKSAHRRSALPLATNGTQEGIARRPEGESQPTPVCSMLLFFVFLYRPSLPSLSQGTGGRGSGRQLQILFC